MPEPIPAWQPPLVEQFVSTDSSNLLIHYFGDVFDWHGYVKFLSLAALRETSRDVPLEKLFVEPHVAPQALSSEAFDDDAKKPPTQALSAALAEHPRLVLLGDPGSGKSTVVNWICTALGRGMEGPLARLLGGPLVPLPMILRELEIDGEFAAVHDPGERWDWLLDTFLDRPVAAHLKQGRMLYKHRRFRKSDEQVKELQRMLQKAGLMESPPDGFFGNKTEAAVKAFQRDHGLTADGIVGTETWQALGGRTNLLYSLLESGQAIVLLDGIDEIGDIKLREALRDAVHEGMRRYRHVRWVLTSRIVGYDEVDFEWPPAPPELASSRPELGEVLIGGLMQADNVRIYDEWRNGKKEWEIQLPRLATRRYLAPFNDAQVEHFTRLWWAHHESNPHLAGTKPAQFLGALRQSAGARSLGRLPHLLTMIALIYRVRAELPDGRALLYSFIADAYLGTLDKERGLEHLRPIPHNVEEMSRWLAAVGWHLQRRRGESDAAEEGKRAESETLLGREELLDILEGVIRPKPARAGEKAFTARETAGLFLEYAGRRSGLLLPRGEERYAFLHLSFQEYFAALYLRDQVTDPEWWEAANEPATDGSGRADFIRYAALPAWRETLIFLWESASLVSPKLPQRLVAGLFGWKRDPHQWGQFPAPTVEQWKDKQQRAKMAVESKRVLLAAMLSVDPHVELTAEARHALWERCWPYEIAWQDSAWEASAWEQFGSAAIARHLLSRAACLEESWRVFRDSAARARPSALYLSGCTGLSDVTALAGLTGLQRLYLSGCTGLSDATALAGLTGLQEIDLSGCTGLGDVTALAGLTGLQWLDLRGCTGLSEGEADKLRKALPKAIILTT